MIISYFLMKHTVHRTEFEHFQGSLWYPLLFFVLHRFTVAIKYASLSSSEYIRFMDPKNRDRVNGYIEQLQLTNAWMKSRHNDVVDFLLISF